MVKTYDSNITEKMWHNIYKVINYTLMWLPTVVKAWDCNEKKQFAHCGTDSRCARKCRVSGHGAGFLNANRIKIYKQIWQRIFKILEKF
jgi:hypothetical protein